MQRQEKKYAALREQSALLIREAEVAYSTRQWDRMAKRCEEAIALMKQIPAARRTEKDVRWLDGDYWRLADAYDHLGMQEDNLAAIKIAKKLLCSLKNPDYIFEGQYDYSMGNACLKLQRNDEAMEHFKNAIRAFEKIADIARDDYASTQYAQSLMRLDGLKQENNPAVYRKALGLLCGVENRDQYVEKHITECQDKLNSLTPSSTSHKRKAEVLSSNSNAMFAKKQMVEDQQPVEHMQLRSGRVVHR